MRSLQKHMPNGNLVSFIGLRTVPSWSICGREVQDGQSTEETISELAYPLTPAKAGSGILRQTGIPAFAGMTIDGIDHFRYFPILQQGFRRGLDLWGRLSGLPFAGSAWPAGQPAPNGFDFHQSTVLVQPGGSFWSVRRPFNRIV